MKQLISITAISFLMICHLYGQSQKNFTVNFNNIIGTVKPLADVNVGPGNALAGYQDARIKMIRTMAILGEQVSFHIIQTSLPLLNQLI